MHMVAITEAKARLTELVRTADDEPVYLLRHSKPAGVLLSHARYEQLIEQLEDAEDRIAVLEDKLDPDDTISLDELNAQVAAANERELTTH